MAKAHVVVSDTPSEEVRELRRLVHTLLHMLESAEASLTAGATAEDVLNAWADAVRTGKDNNPASIANVSSTGRDVTGVYPSPKVPARPKSARVVDLPVEDESL